MNMTTCPDEPTGCLTPQLREALYVFTGLQPDDHLDFENIAVEPGQLDPTVLMQTHVWVDIEGVRHRLETMSAEYRVNVLSFLEKHAPAMIEAVRIRILVDAIAGVTPALTARDQVDQLDHLTPGWTHHTQLGHRLHELNRTRPDPVTPVHIWTRAVDTDQPETLRDDDSGVWQVHTESGTTHQIDLEKRQLRRIPADRRSNGTSTPPNGRPVTRLDYDGQWLPLDALMQCTLGRSLVALDHQPGPGGFRISTKITAIRRVPDP